MIIILSTILTFSGLRLLGGGPTTDCQDAGALSHSRYNIDIYSNSWGYVGLGTSVISLQPLITRAFEEGSTEVCCNSELY